MLRKIVAILCVLMILLLAACGNSVGVTTEETGQETQTPAAEESSNTDMPVESDSASQETLNGEAVPDEVAEPADDENDTAEVSNADNDDGAVSEVDSDTEDSETEESTVVSNEEGSPEVEETLYVTTSLNVRSGPGTEYDKVGLLSTGDEVTRTQSLENGWSKIVYEGEECYVSSQYLSTEKIELPSVIAESINYPLEYSDDTCTITIDKQWYNHAWCYIAHVELSDYSRLATECANGSYNNGFETTSSVAERVGAILCINGCYSAPYLEYPVMRDGEVCHNAACNVPAVYSANTGIFSSPADAGVAGERLSDLAASGEVKDTFCFGPAFLSDGEITVGNDASRAQRTFIGTNGEPGDLYIVVSEGRNVDGESSGLTYKECASLLQELGCTFGVPLDGGGSSTMVFNGVVLNHLPNESERAVVDFVYIK